jgi:hypothetical protein
MQIHYPEQIHSHYENKTDAARLRAKVDWYEKGEQSTKYFFNLERKKWAK